MRVTKIIREYVEKTVISRLPYGEPTQKFKEEQQKLSDLHRDLNDQVRAYAKSLVEAENANLPEGFKLSVTCGNLVTQSYCNSPLHCAASSHEQEIRKKRNAAIESILVELELGATKADLERLIAEAINM